MAGRRNLGGRNGFDSHVAGPKVSIGGAATDTLAFYGATGSVQPAAYTVTNHTNDRALNESGDTVAQVANVLGTLINDLKAQGLIA